MKKITSAFLAVVMLVSLCVSAVAVEDTEETTVTPRSTMSLSFSDLQPNEIALSSQFHSVSDHDALLEIISCTWGPASQAVRIGWYNVDTGELYSVRYTGGSVQDERINSNTVPDGDYKICIKNVGTKAITGAMNYRVD